MYGLHYHFLASADFIKMRALSHSPKLSFLILCNLLSLTKNIVHLL
ncbi:hypothetical protein HORM4_1060022 [Vibrio harveyi]|nr:hypothetical protein HORM4_1060022 [Vibrio harveyi]